MIKAILVLTLISLSLSTESYKCLNDKGQEAKYTCATNQTCCQSSLSLTGFQCFPSVDAVCCGDKINAACPSNTKCNISTDPSTPSTCGPADHKPSPDPSDSSSSSPSSSSSVTSSSYSSSSSVTSSSSSSSSSVTSSSSSSSSSVTSSSSSVTSTPSLKFLEENLSYTTDLKDITKEELQQLTNGFLKGIKIFNGIPVCKQDDQVLQDLIKKLYEMARTFDVSKAADQAQKMIAVVQAIKERIIQLAPQCPDTAKQTQELMAKLTAYFANEYYNSKLIGHTIMNINKIQKRAKDFTNNFEKQTYEKNGEDLGSLTQFLLFWDFK